MQRFDLAALSSTERYKLLGGLVVPRPIAWVTSLSRDGQGNAAPFSFFNVMAEEPPLVVLGIGVTAAGGAKDTTVNIRETGEFVVNLVDEALAEAMNVTAVDFPPDISELEITGLRLIASERVAPPRIEASPVQLECRRHVTLQVGPERWVILGEVLLIHVRDGLVNPKTLRTEDEHAPIGRLFGPGYVRTHDRFDMPRMNYGGWLEKNGE